MRKENKSFWGIDLDGKNLLAGKGLFGWPQQAHEWGFMIASWETRKAAMEALKKENGRWPKARVVSVLAKLEWK